MRPRLEISHESGFILRCAVNVGNSFKSKHTNSKGGERSEYMVYFESHPNDFLSEVCVISLCQVVPLPQEYLCHGKT